jgi:hypothetical protein
MPWANDGGSVWNARRCVPLDADPKHPGDSCIVQGNAYSGWDNCDIASMCWHVDPDTLEGVCVAFCTGTEQDPVCDDPSLRCNICNDGVLILCLPHCDPLLQDCPDGEGCYWVADKFVCSPDISGPDAGSAGDPCEYSSACDPGLQCFDAQYVPGCAGPAGCCAPYCDVNVPSCNAAAGEECLPWWEEEDQAPTCPNLQRVGLCIVPP